ncbi:MAG: hypothetical protein NXH75_07325 [Halobacteriovoraceae bacterium]|nr:hypothetical protein [Halobacteriovoraceae bacterium]
MKKTLRILTYSILAIIVAAGGYLAYRFTSNPQTIYPYPYETIKIPPQEVKQASDADVIILGDSAGTYLADYMPRFISETQKQIRKPLIVYNWSRQGENLAHVLAKVKSLKRMPLLFIYHGGLDELTRRRFDRTNILTLFKNIKLTKDESFLTTIYSAPIASKLLYWPMDRVELGPSSPTYPLDMESTVVIKYLEALYSVFKWEATELTDYLKLNDAQVWFVPQAYNLTERPVRVCEATINLEVEKALDQANAFIKKKKTKDALKIIKAVLLENKSHALALHTMGNLLVSQGQYQDAKRAYFQSMIYDCGMTRANPILLKILMEQFEKKEFKIIDFNRMVTSFVGRNILFEGPRKPQSIYYERLIDKMIFNFRKLIKD